MFHKSDIVQRLMCMTGDNLLRDCSEGADEIERLRAELEQCRAALVNADRVIRNTMPMDSDLDLPEDEFDGLEMDPDEFDRLVAESHARTAARGSGQ